MRNYVTVKRKLTGSKMVNWCRDCWNSLMDGEKNPLKNIPDANSRNATLQILAWMWFIIFGVCVGSSMIFGLFTLLSITLIHLLLVGGIATTLVVFQIAKRYQVF